MSGSGSWSSYLGVEDPQWLCMLTLFVASLVTLALHFAQYFQHWLVGNEPAAAEEEEEEEEEAAALLGWALSLKSWKKQWRAVWCKALNDRSREREVNLMTANTTAVTVRQVTPIKKELTGLSVKKSLPIIHLLLFI